MLYENSTWPFWHQEGRRLHTLEAHAGDLIIGGSNPLRLQSMTNTNTNDTASAVAQIIRLVEAGAELVRLTAQGQKEASNLAVIKKTLRTRGVQVPLIADIHFNPAAAEEAARIVEKVRINPGNYTDRNKGQFTFSDAEYANSIERIRDRMLPLIKICKQNGTAMRIGSNHGSLSERIMSRYGDSPEGMVESAMEFIRICEDFNYYNIVLSMKSSNTRVMVQATRLLVQRMSDNGRIYPLHLGVTEAGDGDDGIIKSVAGIGALLADGIGDTIRVSLTGAPEPELPVAKVLKSCFEQSCSFPVMSQLASDDYRPFEYHRRKSDRICGAGAGQQPIVVGDNTINPKPDWIVENDKIILAENEKIEIHTVSSYELKENSHPCLVMLNELPKEGFLEKVAKDKSVIFCLQAKEHSLFDFARNLNTVLNNRGMNTPLIIRHEFSTGDDLIPMVYESAPLFLDGIADGIWINTSDNNQAANSLSFKLLQACRSRFTATEFISCPSCGRTRFNIEDAVKNIRKRTDHLPGITIGVMGCIVNGPGEMADADYGYVGAGKGKITLFKGREAVKKDVPEELAVDELIKLIKTHGDWKDKPE